MPEQLKVAGTYRTDHPIWEVVAHQHRSLPWLAERTGYSHSHVKGVKAGIQAASPAFRAKCAWALDLPEHMLFIADAPAEQTADPVAEVA